MQYQCKKCSVVFPRIFDLITHQKKLCYKDEDDDAQDESQTEDSMDATDQTLYKNCTLSGPSDSSKSMALTTASSGSGSSTPLMPSPKPEPEKNSPKPDLTEKPKQNDTTPKQVETSSQSNKSMQSTLASPSEPQPSASQAQQHKQSQIGGRPGPFYIAKYACSFQPFNNFNGSSSE